jgi:5-methylcytosine-specific restriction endonuclease McrA
MTIQEQTTSVAPQTGRSSLVVRSTVPANLEYGEYKPYLRVDFWHSCAYCTLSEAEARAIRFTIDHYEPKEARKDLVNEYSNLMYACDVCNIRKGDRYPPVEARKGGHRFFRPDQDIRSDHFERSEIYLREKSNVGYYTIQALDLNRASLRRVRELRARLSECDQYIVEGITALRAFPADTLPTEIRAKALRKIKEAMNVAEDLSAAIDSVLRDFAKSPLVDPDGDAEERAKERAKQLQELEAMYPGSWRAPRKRKKKRR